MTLGDNSQRLLQDFIRRLEHLDEQRRDLGEDMRGIYAEARDLHGFDVKAMREVIKLRRIQDTEKHAKHLALVDDYMHALGMTPIEEAIERSRTADPPFLPPEEA